MRDDKIYEAALRREAAYRIFKKVKLARLSGSVPFKRLLLTSLWQSSQHEEIKFKGCVVRNLRSRLIGIDTGESTRHGGGDGGGRATEHLAYGGFS